MFKWPKRLVQHFFIAIYFSRKFQFFLYCCNINLFNWTIGWPNLTSRIISSYYTMSTSHWSILELNKVTLLWILVILVTIVIIGKRHKVVVGTPHGKPGNPKGLTRVWKQDPNYKLAYLTLVSYYIVVMVTHCCYRVMVKSSHFLTSMVTSERRLSRHIIILDCVIIISSNCIFVVNSCAGHWLCQGCSKQVRFWPDHFQSLGILQKIEIL